MVDGCWMVGGGWRWMVVGWWVVDGGGWWVVDGGERWVVGEVDGCGWGVSLDGLHIAGDRRGRREFMSRK